MGTRSKTITGARAILWINGKKAGIFNSCSADVAYGVTPIYTLGKHGPQELVYTDMSPVDVRVSGFRVFNNGPYAIGSVPQLKDLLTHEDISVTIIDRGGVDNQGHEVPKDSSILTVQGVRPTGYGISTTSRGLYDLNISMQGLTVYDETNLSEQGEDNATVYG